MIRITRQVDYGIVLLVRFAAGGGDEILAARDLARETRLPLPMVSKILKKLAREGLLASQRGVKGGYRLVRGPDRISVAEVIRALDGPIAITQCTDRLEGDCALEGGCPVSWRWQKINGAIQDALFGITLAEMCRPPQPARAGLPVALGVAAGAASGRYRAGGGAAVAGGGAAWGTSR